MTNFHTKTTVTRFSAYKLCVAIILYFEVFYVKLQMVKIPNLKLT
jgi:hypothetical protein